MAERELICVRVGVLFYKAVHVRIVKFFIFIVVDIYLVLTAAMASMLVRASGRANDY